MFALLIFPILVAGFFACHIHPVHFYKLHKYVGQYLYLKSAELGLKCFALAVTFTLIGHFWIPDSFSIDSVVFSLQVIPSLVNNLATLELAHNIDAHKMAWFCVLSGLTFVSALLIKAWTHLALYFRFGNYNAKVHVIGQLLEDRPLDFLLYLMSLDKDKHVMLTMEDRKVYVGKVISLGEPSATEFNFDAYKTWQSSKGTASSTL